MLTLSKVVSKLSMGAKSLSTVGLHLRVKNLPFYGGPWEVDSIFRTSSLGLNLSENDLPISCMGAPSCRYSENCVREGNGPTNHYWQLCLKALIFSFAPYSIPSSVLAVPLVQYLRLILCLLREQGRGCRHLLAFHTDFQLIFLFSVCGFSDSSYLRVLHYKSSFLVSPT